MLCAMKNVEPYLFDVKVHSLQRLDEFARNPGKLDDALGNGADAEMDDTRFLDAARVLFGREVEHTLAMLKPGHPGFLYAQKRRELIAAIRGTPVRPPVGREPDDAVASPAKIPPADVMTEADGVRPQQPL